ncbi:MAG: ribonuclease P protein component [Xanthomonadales bacterium]|nr:ribonuclease P protein component [Xanthomonadales bacterium]
MCPVERFPRTVRLTAAREYTLAFGQGERLASARLLMRARPNDTGSARLGMAIARKRARTAVLRNAIKRQLRERFRRRCADWAALDLVVLLRGPLGPQDLVGLADEFEQLVERALRRIARRTATDEASD